MKAIVIGGGIGGCATAIALRRIGADVEVHEARREDDADTGAFLQIAPNGMRVLAQLGVDPGGFTPAAMRFRNARGRQVGEVGVGDARVIERARLLAAMRDGARAAGATLTFGNRLQDLHTPAGRVTATFAGGATAEGDVLVGCDGLRSRTRGLALPDAPAPVYTGIVDCGGFAHIDPARADVVGVQVMTFGRRAFFGHLVKPDGEVFWFSNVGVPTEPDREDLRALLGDAWHRHLRDLHRDDPAPIPEILAATEGGVGRWPQHAVEPLPRWHQGPVALLGDAAHAMPPHIGQGASLAMEDALVLAQCLRDLPTPAAAFAAYEHLRRDRAEQALRWARRIGDRKIPNPVTGWFRDLLLPTFLRMAPKANAVMYDHRIDFEDPVKV